MFIARFAPLFLLLLNPLSTPAQTKFTPVAPVSNRPAGFTRLDPATTGITFTNTLSDQIAGQNQIRLNGSGVAAGDVDGDGLVDLYFCGLERRNALFKNLGNWKFQDISAAAGVEVPYQFSSGALLADVDGDFDLDLLVTSVGGGTRLFINDSKGKFNEVNVGLQRTRAGTTMAMADIDLDGDLDLYVANYRSSTIRTTGLAMLEIDGVKQLAPKDKEDYEITPTGNLLEHGEPDFLYENTGRGFSAVSFTSGRFLDEDGKPLAKAPRDWGLTAMFRDINGDGFPDLYVCNDFHSPDRIWMNDGRGSFRAIDRLAIRNTSTFSMGVDFADINRDGFDDILIVDMLDPDRRRRMVQIAAMQPSQYLHGIYNDRPQFDRNTLQLNRGDGTYAEIAHFAGIEASGWSWCPIFVDVDLDGFEDWLTTSGHMFDTQDLDAARLIDEAGPYPPEKIPLKLLKYPRLETQNSAFRNMRNLRFQNASAEWGFDYKGVSHGMVTADLDNDGDLDLAHSSLNGPAGLYRNESSAPRVAVRLRGLPPNTQAIGAKITVTGGPVTQTQEVISGGRYLSGADPLRMFAAGAAKELKISVRWPGGATTEVASAPNQIVEIAQQPAPRPAQQTAAKKQSIFTEVPLAARHIDEEFNDYERQPLLAWKLSQTGPGLTWFDHNNDGWEDLIVPSGRGGRAQLFLNQKGQTFARQTNAFPKPATRDQTTILGFQSAGGPHLIAALSNHDDALPVGDRLVALTETTVTQLLAADSHAVGPIALADLDLDGDLDLFLGGASVPGRYPLPANSAIYTNHLGKFILDSGRSEPLQRLGLCDAAVFSDLNNDGRIDLAIAAAWSPVRVFLNTGATIRDATTDLKLAPHTGWWNGITTGDFDADGDQDLIVSNWGLNSKYRATPEHPRNLYFGDIDDNGSFDVIETVWDNAIADEVPERELNVMAMALPIMRERFPTYKAFGLAGFKTAFGPDLKNIQKLSANTLATTFFLNEPGGFRVVELPDEAQFAPAFGICVADFDGNGTEDIFLAQNFFPLPPQTGRIDAGVGLLMLNDGKANFRAAPVTESGIRAYGDQRGAAGCDFDHDGRADLAIGQNAAEVKLYRNALAKPGIRIEGAPPGAVLRLGNQNTWGPAREIKLGSGWRSQDSATQVMTFQNATKILVRWPGGKTTEHPVAPGATEVRLAR